MRKLFVLIISTFSIFIFGNEKSLPQEIIEITEENQKIDIFSQLYFYKEKGKQTFEKNRLPDSLFQKPETLKYHCESFNRETLWMKFKVINKTDKDQIYYYTLRNSYSYKSTIFLHSNDETTELHTYSYQKIKRENTYSNYPTWKIHLPKDELVTVYLKMYESGGRAKMTGVFHSEKDFMVYNMKSSLIHSAYFIFILFIIFFTVYIAHVYKRPFLYFFALYIVFFSVDYLCIHGIGQAFLWTEHEFLLKNTRSISNATSAMFMCLFFGSLYRHFGTPRWVEWVFYGVAAVFGVILCLYGVKFFFGGFSSLFLYVWSLISKLAILFIGIHFYLAFRKDVPYYLPFVFVFHTAFAFINREHIFTYSTNGFVDWLKMNVYHVSLGVEILAWCYFISSKFRDEKRKLTSLEKSLKALQDKQKPTKPKKVQPIVIDNEIEYPQKITLKNNATLDTKDIIYIKSDGHYLEYYTTNKSKAEIDRNSLTKVLATLPPSQFVRIHKSYIVNIEHIEVVNTTSLTLVNGVSVNLSRTYKERFKEVLKMEDISNYA